MVIVTLLQYCTHPLIFSIYLITVSIIVGLLFFYSVASWLFYSVRLIFLGGIIVLFMYVSMLRNEDKVQYNGFSPIVLFLALVLYVRIRINLRRCNLRYHRFSLIRLSELYKNLSLCSLFILITYLLLILFATIKFTESFKGTIIKLR